MAEVEKTAAGVLFLAAGSGRVLLNLRAAYKKHNLTWSLWGGMMEGDESPKACLEREMVEEMGFVPSIERLYPFDVYQSRDGHFRYYSFVAVVEDEFVPILNGESDGYAWCRLGVWPKPMHQGARSSFCKAKSLEKLRLILGQHKPR